MKKKSAPFDDPNPLNMPSASSTKQTWIDKRIKPSLLLIAASMLAACDALIDNALDCVDSDGPEFDRRVLASPVLNQVYNETLTVRIENEPLDDRFLYDFEIIGEPPEGITITQEPGRGRRLFFEGTAIEEGTFDLRIFVAVDAPSSSFEGTSGLCFTSRSRIFQLMVLPV